MDKFNSVKLVKELQTAGLPVSCARSTGVCDYFRELTEEEKVIEKNVLENHNRYEYDKERVESNIIKYQPLGDQIDHLYKALKELKEKGTWDGIDEWFTHIDNVKATHPKNFNDLPLERQSQYL